MRRVFQASSLAEAGHVRNLLEQAGIRTLIRNEQLAGALGEVPFLDALPEICVLRDDDADAAARVIREQHAPGGAVPAGAAAWVCARCGERNEPQFGACWSCGTADGAPP